MREARFQSPQVSIEGRYDGMAPAGLPGLCLPNVTCPATPFTESTVHLLVGMNGLTAGDLYGSPFAATNSDTGVWIAGSAILGQTGNLRVAQASALDKKLDDGIANSGKVFGTNWLFGAGNCVDGDAAGWPRNDDGSSITGSFDYVQTDPDDDCWIIYVIH